MTTSRLITGLAVAASTVVAAAPAASANSVTDWHQHAQHAVVDVAQEPQNAPRSLAMVSGAVYDAVNAIDGKLYEPYLVAPPARRSYSKDAAVASAAHDVLVGLFPAQQPALDGQLAEALAAIPDGGDQDGGVRVGAEAAKAMLAARENDGSDDERVWIIGDQPGEWRPTPPSMVGAGAQLGFMRTFAIPDADMFRSRPPNRLTRRRYARELEEVKSIGSASSTTRTADQTEAARFWNDRRSPWESILDQLAVGRQLSVLETARMLALVHMSAADSAIAAFKAQYHWSTWRPITAIREADTDGNPHTTPDRGWTPLLNTTPSPEHPSAASMVSATITTMLRLYFGTDRIAFTGHSRDTGTTRSYARFSEALREIINARVWGGIHFRSAGERGALEGAKLAAYVWLTRLAEATTA
jgi:hypothetical protein